MKYQKPALSITQQIAHWEARGLVIQDQSVAQSALRQIGLFRLKGYALPFMTQLQAGRSFNSGTSIEQILEHYRFDRELRVLVMRELERIEVAIRTVIVNTLSELHGDPFWYLNATLLGPVAKSNGRVEHFDHPRFLDEVKSETQRSRDVFARHYFQKYTDPTLPPSWLVAECLSFGKWSRLYEHLIIGRTPIADGFNLPVDVLTSWLHCLSFLRNICAHHGMVYRRVFVFTPKTLQRERGYFRDGKTFYCYASVIQILLKSLAQQPDWPVRLKAHLDAFPNISPTPMGFPDRWESAPLWN